MGEWNATTAYYKLNFVRYNGCLYLAKKTNTNVAPGVNAGWQEVWMPCVYDGGTVALDGTYPDMTAGKVMHALLFGNKSYDGSSEQTITAADLGLADAYKPQGSIAFSGLRATPNASNYGFVWNISDNFTTDSRFIEGAGKKYNAGTNVGVIEQNGSYYYDIFGAFVDLSNYALINGTYLDMRVGTATYADGATNDSQGRKIDETYATKDVATQSAAGLMSAADKTKLDGMSGGGGGGTPYYRHNIHMLTQTSSFDV